MLTITRSTVPLVDYTSATSDVPPVRDLTLFEQIVSYLQALYR